jgi:L-fuconolactonase
MSSNDRSRTFGRIYPPRQDWLARGEPEAILDPALPIVDSHHHLWDGTGRYLLEDFLADAGSGHNIVATVLVECGYKNRTDGPEERRSVGEVEFAAHVATQCAANPRTQTRVAAGIVGFADLTLGDRVEPVLTPAVLARSWSGGVAVPTRSPPGFSVLHERNWVSPPRRSTTRSMSRATASNREDW